MINDLSYDITHLTIGIQKVPKLLNKKNVSFSRAVSSYFQPSTRTFRLKHFTVFSNCIKTAQQILKSNILNEFYDK